MIASSHHMLTSTDYIQGGKLLIFYVPWKRRAGPLENKNYKHSHLKNYSNATRRFCVWFLVMKQHFYTIKSQVKQFVMLQYSELNCFRHVLLKKKNKHLLYFLFQSELLLCSLHLTIPVINSLFSLSLNLSLLAYLYTQSRWLHNLSERNCELVLWKMKDQKANDAAGNLLSVWERLIL